MKLKTVRQLKNLKNKKIILRVDFNCPIKNGRVLDKTRIYETLPLINYLLRKKAKLILISHLDDPKGKEKRYSLNPVYKELKLKIKNLKFVDDCLGEKVKEEIEKLKGGEAILLENLRFYPGEKRNDKRFAKALARLGEIYINEAFSVCHRAHASVLAITKYLPSYAGFLLEREIKNLSQILENPPHPLIVLIGGVKISTKLLVIKNLAKKADKILIGGALANNFLKLQGIKIGRSIYEKEMTDETKKILYELKEKLVLPIDVRVKIKNKSKILKLEKLNNFKNFKILDIGPETIKLFTRYIKSAKIIVWNGPVGYFEERPFDRGTKKIVQTILNNKKAKVFIGGGDTLSCFHQIKSQLQISNFKNIFLSTGGGAMLEFLSGKILAGLKPLLK